MQKLIGFGICVAIAIFALPETGFGQIKKESLKEQLEQSAADEDTEDAEDAENQAELDEEKVSPYIQKLRDLINLATNEEDRQCEAIALGLAEAVADKDEFADIQDGGQRTVLYYLVACLIETEQHDSVLPYLEPLVDLMDDKTYHLGLWFHYGRFGDDPLQSQRALVQMGRTNQASLSQISTKDLWHHWRRLEETSAAKDHRYEMVQILSQNNYVPVDKGTRPGVFDFKYANGLMQNGRVDLARTVLLKNPSARAALMTHLANVFEPLRKKRKYEKQFDLLKVAKIERDWEIANIEKNPKLLSARLALSGSWRIAGDIEKAKAVVLESLALIEAVEPDGEPAFTDMDEWHGWLLNELGFIFLEVGQVDEGLEYLRRASLTEENGGTNVSQVINYSLALVGQERHEQAMAVIQKISDGNASDYGKSFVYAVQTCAYAQMGNRIAMDGALSKLLSFEQDNPAAVTRGLLCADRAEQTAAVIMRRLADPKLAEAALLGMQNYQFLPVESAWQKTLRARYQEIIARPDVQKAVAKIGVIKDIPFSSTFWGEL